MTENEAFFVEQNPFLTEESKKKYNFIFNYSNLECDINRKLRFNLREDETIHNLKNKIASFIGKTLKAKKGEKHIFCNPKDDVQFFCDNKKINNNINCKNFCDIYSVLEFKLFENNYKVYVNYPKVFQLTLPKYIYVNMVVYPSDCDSIFLDRSISDFIWFKSKDGSNWMFLEECLSYQPNLNDVDHFLKLKVIPKFEEKIGEISEAVTTEKIIIFPQKCPFERRHEYTKHSIQSPSFRVVSYNILSNLYDKHIFNYCPAYALDGDYRKQLILKELTGYNADIICLQETDLQINKLFFRPEFSKLNFENIYSSKIKVSEGLSIYYRTDKFQKIKAQSFVIGEEIKKNPKMKNLWRKIQRNENLAKNLTSLNTIFQIMVLKSTLTKEDVLILGHTHLHYHPDKKFIRFLQVVTCYVYLAEMKMQMQKKFMSDKISIIFCGDFNSEPDSGVFNFLTKGELSHNDVLDSSNKLFQNHFLFKSAYGCPNYTNFTEQYKGCLDYIFYDDSLGIKQNVPLLTKEELEEHLALPSIVVPSDHQALITDFEFK